MAAGLGDPCTAPPPPQTLSSLQRHLHGVQLSAPSRWSQHHLLLLRLHLPHTVAVGTAGGPHTLAQGTRGWGEQSWTAGSSSRVSLRARPVHPFLPHRSSVQLLTPAGLSFLFLFFPTKYFPTYHQMSPGVHVPVLGCEPLSHKAW